MVVYLDLIVLLNALCNVFILSLTAYIVRQRVSKVRLILGTIVATAFVPLIIYFPSPLLQSFFTKLLYSVLIIVTTFHFHTIYKTMQQLFTFYFISFLVGGGLISFHFLIQDSLSDKMRKILLTVQSVYGDELHLLLLVVGFPLLLLFVKRRMDVHVEEKITYDQMYRCRIVLNGIEKETTGFIDSGNQLYDPLTKLPVVISDAHFLRTFFNENDWRKLKTFVETDDFNHLDEHLSKKVTFVPFTDVSGETRLLYTLRPDKLTIYYGDRYIETNEALIGIRLEALIPDRSYQLLLHPHIIYGRGTKSA